MSSLLRVDGLRRDIQAADRKPDASAASAILLLLFACFGLGGTSPGGAALASAALKTFFDSKAQ
ncbi:hypothetical protein [Marinobacterium nitratireducens]|uniref:hypothetical protein n=1 Tax=Marinobacterium nitratireducens TaxID=518897 RepID=UPI001669C21F|nr:hypothetical protein [Marinobacterium nitratireducens]